MLDRHHPEQGVAGWIESLPCHIQFPPNLRANFERTGPSQTVADDIRSSVRIHCCGSTHRAALLFRQSLPAFPREAGWHSVYTTNISKHGCGFFHSAIVYPSEQFAFVLLTGIERWVEVMWCRRIDTHCFAVGTQFCNPPDDAVAPGAAR